MKIGIEARKLYSHDKHGMDVVALELVRHIPLLDTENEYIVFTQPGYDRVKLPTASNLRVVVLPLVPVPIWEQIVLPLAVAHYGCDMLHCTGNTAPILAGVPVVITLHDILYLENNRAIRNASTLFQKIRNRYCRFVVPRVVRKSDMIITVSKYQERVIKMHLSVGDEKIQTIYNGVSDHFHLSCDSHKAQIIKEKYQLPSEFILFLGSKDPKKNSARVILAYKQFLEITNLKTPLVVADISEKKLSKLLAAAKAEHIRPHIISTGYVPNADISVLYSLASVFLYPSMKESFGIPILEAMASGTPVITSNTSAMPEIAENAAFIVDPFDSLSIAKAMGQILEHDILRDNLIKKGIQQAQKFSFKRMAEEVLLVYSDVLKSKKR
jgi:glycosyltransferase involved in cell wall biosynthesis